MKNSVTLEIIVIIQREYKGAAYSIYKLKYRVPNKVPIAFHSGELIINIPTAFLNTQNLKMI